MTDPSRDRPILTIVGDRVALGPLRRDLAPLFERWMNDLQTQRLSGFPDSVPACVSS